MRSLPNHAWLFNLSDRFNHQLPVPLSPDDEGMVTAACDTPTLPFRLAGEGELGRCTHCGTLFKLVGETDITCHCGATWPRAHWASLTVSIHVFSECFPCLLKVGDDAYTTRAPRQSTEDFRRAALALQVAPRPEPDESKD